MVRCLYLNSFPSTCSNTGLSGKPMPVASLASYLCNLDNCLTQILGVYEKINVAVVVNE